MGKYDKIVAALKKLPVEDQDRQTKIGAFKASVKNHTASTLAQNYIALREGSGQDVNEKTADLLIEKLGKAGIEALLYEVNLRLEGYEQLLEDSQEAHSDGWGAYGVGENMLRLPTGDTVRVQKEPYGRVTDKEAFRLWCIANGYEPKLQLWPSTMNTIVKERLLEGLEPPDGTEAYSYVKIIFTGAKK